MIFRDIINLLWAAISSGSELSFRSRGVQIPCRPQPQGLPQSLDMVL